MGLEEKLKIGFEFHAQVNTKQKLYCECSTDYSDVKPNSNVCPTCLGLPGSKPYPITKDVLNAVIELALLLDAKIITDKEIYVQRKHYDYPDLPNGYQKTSTPIAVDGMLNGVRISEIHLEDDPGKYDISKNKVDYNRSGVPLIEIVTAPDIHSQEEARDFWNEISKILEYTGKFRKEPGSMRSDTNISMGYERVEVKNVNSSKGVYHAIAYEIKRQSKAIRRGHEIKRETRGFLDDKMITVPLRSKEQIADYRYIPDPDIPPIIITQEMVEATRAGLGETPAKKYNRFMEQYGLHPEQARSLTSDLTIAELFEEASKRANCKSVANWMSTDFKQVLNENNIDVKAARISAEDIAYIVGKIDDSSLQKEDSRHAIESYFRENTKTIAQHLEDYFVKFDDREIDKLISEVLEKNSEKLDPEKGVGFIVGQVIKGYGRKINAKIVAKKVMERLGSN